MGKKLILLLCAVCLLAGMLPVTALAADNTYVINGASVRWDDFTSRPGHCRAYAEKMYQKIWGEGFSNNFYDEDNFLRELENDQLTLTEEHLKAYVSAAVLGSTIRASSAYFLHRNDGNLGHSQIIVQKDENGFTVLEGGMKEYPYCGENYYTWSDYVNAHWLGGRYGYIKYIQWPGAPSYYEGYGDTIPQVSDPVITKAEDGSGFSISYTAADDLSVERAYIRVWPQGLTEGQGTVYSCEWDGETATAAVPCSFSDDVKNLYCKWYAVDSSGNTGGEDKTPRLISFYDPQVDCVGVCKVKTEQASVCAAPYVTVNGQETVKYTASKGSALSVRGVYRNADGDRWYLLSSGLWVSEADVRYDTFSSLIDWIFKDYDNKEFIYMDGQILFIGQ